MQIDFTVLVPHVSSATEIDGWVCGQLASASALPDARSTAMHPWSSSIAHAPISERDALVDFINLEPGSTDEIVRFIRRYGLFSHGDLTRFAGEPAKVKAFWRDSKAKQPLFATNISSVVEVRDRITAVLKLARSGRSRDRDAAMEELAKENRVFVKFIERTYPKDFAKQLLSHFVSLGLAFVHLGVVPNRGKMIAVASAADVRSALYVAVLSELVSGTHLKKCKRVGCPKLFLATRDDRQYHDPNCQHADVMRRRRKRQGRGHISAKQKK